MIEAEIRELTPQPTVAARMTQPMAEMDLAALFDEYLAEAELKTEVCWPLA